MAEFNPLDINIDEFRKDLTTKETNTFKRYNAVKLSEIIVAHGLSKKSFETLKPMAKKDLKNIILNGDAEPKARIKNTNSDGFANDILDIANSIKKQIHGKPLTTFTQEQGKKAIDGATEKINEYDENVVSKLGWLGIGIGGALLIADTVIGLENIKDMAKEFLEIQEPQAQQQEVKKDDSNKQ